MHWVHGTYWLPGPAGNDIQKTNVPNLRMRFRYDNHCEEVGRFKGPGGFAPWEFTSRLPVLSQLASQ
jgi:hypothetical protein